MTKCEGEIRERNTKYEPHSELTLVRHAPVAEPGRLWGRRDPPARIEPRDIEILRERLPVPEYLVTSPAQRCRQTAAALWPTHSTTEDDRLWEQDFGAHEGLPYADLPDLGPLDGAELALWTPPGGESFADLCARAGPALDIYGRLAAKRNTPVTLVVHAGVIRAALSQVLGTVHAGLAFEIGTLSITRLRCGPDGPVSVIGANQK